MNNKNEMLKIIFISDTRDIVNNFIGDYPNQGFLVDTKGKNPYYHYEFIKLYLKYHRKSKKLIKICANKTYEQIIKKFTEFNYMLFFDITNYIEWRPNEMHQGILFLPKTLLPFQEKIILNLNQTLKNYDQINVVFPEMKRNEKIHPYQSATTLEELAKILDPFFVSHAQYQERDTKRL